VRTPSFAFGLLFRRWPARPRWRNLQYGTQFRQLCKLYFDNLCEWPISLSTWWLVQADIDFTVRPLSQKSLLEAQRRLMALKTSHPSISKEVDEVLALLALDGTDHSLRTSRPREFSVVTAPSGEVLVEGVRGEPVKSGSYRCPRRTYNALAVVLDRTTTPLDFQQLLEGVEHQLGARPSEFQLRVPLRLWAVSDPVLVRRVRAKYSSALKRGNFRRAAERLWRSMSPQST